MLDAMQNTILNKPDSAPKRPNSPSAEVNKLESKFEDMLAKAAQSKTTKDTESAQKAQDKGKGVGQDPEVVLKNTIKGAQSKQSTSPLEAAPTGKTSSAKAATSPAAFDFKDSNGQDSKIALQEKIKNTKDTKTPEVNPLVEALSAPLAAKEANKNAPKETKVSGSELPQSVGRDVKAQSVALNNASTQAEQIQKTPTPINMSAPQKTGNEDKTLADVEKIATAKGLNPSNITLEQEEAKVTPKPKVIPESAKQSISYEYENNVDRIAIVQRGKNKPKNITSKISNEYPVASKTEEENVSINSASLLKDRPQIG
ncbi:MAG: hypothetical protein J1E28_04670 [Helicobacter sp.]|uniref:hypothetical protein n=1 Tax=Helicobacter sp. TaxID=218 RepID=UPI0025BB054E|nr:hypothetical protein [Helicobacter sp.]MCH5313667.1 hypothetical protein [Helicobacter sp.]